MKSVMLIVMLAVCLCCVGCLQEFGAGVATGVVAAEKLSEDAQNRFIEAVNAMNEETAKLNANVDAEALQSLKGREKDPVTWIALASVLANAFLGGKAVGKKKPE